MDGQEPTPPAGSRRRRSPEAGDPAPNATAHPDQTLVDAEEHAAEERYLSLCQLALVIQEALRRAEAMTRLELALAHRTR